MGLQEIAGLFDFRESWTQGTRLWGVGGRKPRAPRRLGITGPLPPGGASPSAGSDVSAAVGPGFLGGLGGWTPRASRPLPVSPGGGAAGTAAVQTLQHWPGSRWAPSTTATRPAESRPQGGQRPGPEFRVDVDTNDTFAGLTRPELTPQRVRRS